MSVVFEVDPARPAQAAEAVAAATDAVAAGELVIFPTDTVYGLACRPADPAATARLFAAKRRPSGLTLPVLAASAEDAFELAVATEPAVRLAERFWPGPLTMVLPRGPRSRGWRLGDATGSIGVRVPAHALSLSLLRRAGPLAATSANLSGEQPIQDRLILQEVFGDAVAVYLLAPPSTSASSLSSTVVDLTGREVAVLRQGPIAQVDILAVAGRVGGMAS